MVRRGGGERESPGVLVRAGGLPDPIESMPYALLTDPTAPDQVHACLSNGDVRHETHHGDHWQQLPFSLGRWHRAPYSSPRIDDTAKSVRVTAPARGSLIDAGGRSSTTSGTYRRRWRSFTASSCTPVPRVMVAFTYYGHDGFGERDQVPQGSHPTMIRLTFLNRSFRKLNYGYDAGGSRKAAVDDRRIGYAKQNESVEQSPPSRRTWCARWPGNSTSTSGLSDKPPSGLTSAMNIAPGMPSG